MDFNLYTSFPDELEDEWNSLLDKTSSHVPFMRYEYLKTWWQTRGGGEWPKETNLFLVTARRAGKLVGGAPLFIARTRDGNDALLLVGSIEISDYLDLVANPQDLPDFCAGLLSFLQEANLPAWNSLELYNIIETSPTLAALQAAAAKQGWNLSWDRLQHSPYIPLPGDWETYLARIDKKQRHEVRRKMRRAQESAIPVTWYMVNNPETLARETEDFMTLMAFETEKEQFLTPLMKDHFRSTVQCAFDKNCLLMAFLSIGEQKAAGYLGFNYLNRLWIYNSGMDPAYREYSPGWVLLGNLLQWANQEGFSEFDFMRGDEEYKYRFGSVDRFVTRITLVPQG